MAVRRMLRKVLGYLYSHIFERSEKREGVQSPLSILELPPEMKFEVLKYMGVQDLKTLSLVNKAWGSPAQTLLKKKGTLSLNQASIDWILTIPSERLNYKRLKLSFTPPFFDILRGPLLPAFRNKVVAFLRDKLEGGGAFVDGITFGRLTGAPLETASFLHSVFSTCPNLTQLTILEQTPFEVGILQRPLPTLKMCRTVHWLPTRPTIFLPSHYFLTATPNVETAVVPQGGIVHNRGLYWPRLRNLTVLDQRLTSYTPSLWNLICIAFGVLSFSLFMSWVGTSGSGTGTCSVGESRYGSFDAWGGRLAIQNDEGECRSEWNCAIQFSFSKGSVHMSRGCLSPEEGSALVKNTDGILWVMTNDDEEQEIGCFVRKDLNTTMTCAYDPSWTLIPRGGGRIPKISFERFRTTLCDSPNLIQRPWWGWLWFWSESPWLGCPSSTAPPAEVSPWTIFKKKNYLTDLLDKLFETWIWYLY